MARIQPTPDAAGPGTSGENGPSGPGRRKAVRYAVPVAVAGVAAATIGIGSALASSGDPDLPEIGAKELIAKVAASDARQLSGSVRITTDLGLPSLPSGMSFGGQGNQGGKGGASPQERLTELASGTHTLRVAADGPERQRVSIVERAAEYSVVRDGDQVWAYDSGSNSAYHAKAPEGHERHPGSGLESASPQELARRVLDAAGPTTDVSVDGTAKVAGRDAYRLTLKPKQGDTTVGAVRIAVDAKNGVPLKFTVDPKGGGKAVVDVAFTKVSFDKPAASSFSFTPPKGAKVTEAGEGRGKGHGQDFGKGVLPVVPPGTGAGGGERVIGTGWSSIAEFSGGGKGKLPAGTDDRGGKGAKGDRTSADSAALLDSFGSKVTGDFGSGRIVSTRLVNALLTDDGKVYVGAVTKDALLKAADSAAR
ncbi:LolA family protein [Streptomyces caatingaensis]|uniref:Membrane protein n=1 Tax=Streptomyces caatingaensis TaxID=1678637 RepID=A0A0K9XAC5_9ACTN|nr:outer membrane lipoprotein carrier protein LolA [Streptomyces caatingaensis]KNB50051.1 membrane protein [Streptomyces caatingaensis]